MGMNEWVKPDGTLNEASVAGRETLYTGMNGQRVERLFLVTGESVIFKPLTNDSQLGREAWVYEHVLPGFPPIYPRLLAYSGTKGKSWGHAGMLAEEEAASCAVDADAMEATDRNGGEGDGCWCLFEDLGPLSHEFTVRTAAALMPSVARWQALPTEGLQTAPLLGPKPMIDVLLRDVLRQEEELRAALAEIACGRESLARVLDPLRDGGGLPEGWKLQVLSHGDLHLGNYALVNEEVKVLDWEHVHLNSPYWDLYHVLDLSHPVFPKALDAVSRQYLLDLYVREADIIGMKVEPVGFKREYARFAAVFSLWMLLLIEKDLKAAAAAAGLPAKWSPEQLRRQRTETIDSFAQCAELLG
ncbi:phosphotransferase [Paenibacillus sacheonensis]|uniref:Phosphotransferase n=1 Tax=Paenibacillus sacheonensis TaxID=742054 RepID=A0A7X5C486_9BACL|nr:phosphotransferase [Paenibacillus sacheonensis]NBC72124.1 phosphotransferase [Paenibacillus sacheonensis]